MINFRSRLAFEVVKERHGVHRLVENLQLETSNNSLNDHGISGGTYDRNHKILRQKWYQVTNKMLSSDSLRELVDFSARQVVEDLAREVGSRNWLLDNLRLD